MIPARLIRTVPEVSEAADALWADTRAMHPGWEAITYREPIDPAAFPLTAPAWPLCSKPAQKAGLIRLEALQAGGIYLDSDVRIFRPLDPLRALQGFAAYEDPGVVPDAVLGFEASHPAAAACLALALERIRAASGQWRTDGPWGTGPGVTTTVLPGRADVLLLGPESFYPLHYTQLQAHHGGSPAAAESFEPPPWCFGIHLYHASWL